MNKRLGFRVVVLVMDGAKSREVLINKKKNYVRLYVRLKDGRILYVSLEHFLPKFDLCPFKKPILSTGLIFNSQQLK